MHFWTSLIYILTQNWKYEVSIRHFLNISVINEMGPCVWNPLGMSINNRKRKTSTDHEIKRRSNSTTQLQNLISRKPWGKAKNPNSSLLILLTHCRGSIIVLDETSINIGAHSLVKMYISFMLNSKSFHARYTNLSIKAY